MSNKEELYNNAYNNSVGENKKVRYIKMPKEIYNKRLKVMLLAGAMIGILATSTLVYGAKNYTQMINESKIITEETSDYLQLVNNETSRTNDNKDFYYDTGDIASSLASDPENIDKGIYGVYLNIGYNDNNKIEKMNEVVRLAYINQMVSDELGNSKGYSNFNDYVVAKGFISEDGTANIQAWEEAMSKMIVNEHNAEELLAQVDEIKSR